MKCSSLLLPAALLALAACEATSPSKSPAFWTGQSTAASQPPRNADRPQRPASQPASTPGAQVIYQNTTSHPSGRATSSGVYRQHGAVTEEIHIGNQPVYPGHSPGPTHLYRGNLGPGYVPAGTTGIYDPATGRVIPVRR